MIQSYRHRLRLAPGDPSLEAIEDRLAAQPPITVPTIVLHGACDGVSLPESSAGHARFFTGPYQRRVVPGRRALPAAGSPGCGHRGVVGAAPALTGPALDASCCRRHDGIGKDNAWRRRSPPTRAPLHRTRRGELAGRRGATCPAPIPDEFVRQVTLAIAAEAWVLDEELTGLFATSSGVGQRIWSWLDYERPIIMYQVIRRSLVRATAAHRRCGPATARDGYTCCSGRATRSVGPGAPGAGAADSSRASPTERVRPSRRALRLRRPREAEELLRQLRQAGGTERLDRVSSGL